MRLPRSIAALAATLCLLITPAAADMGADLRLKPKLDRLLVHAKSEDPAALKAAIDALIDFEAMTRAIRVADWSTLTPAQQQAAIKRITERARTEIEGLVQRLRACRLELVGSRPAAHWDAAASEGSRAVTTYAHCEAAEGPLELEFVLGKGKMKVIDIYTERVSLVKTYRSKP